MSSPDVENDASSEHSKEESSPSYSCSETDANVAAASHNDKVVPRKVQRSVRSEDIGEAILSFLGLRALTLRGESLGPAGARAAAAALRARPGLRALELCWPRRARGQIADGWEALAEGMTAAGTRLRALMLENCYLGASELPALASLLRSDACSELEELTLRYNELGSASGPQLAAALCLPLERLQGLRVLDMNHNCLRDEHVPPLVHLFETSAHLERVDLGSSCFGPEATATVVEALAGRPRLRYLGLGRPARPAAGRAAARAVAGALTRFNCITIDLNRCMGDEEARLLTQTIKDNANILRGRRITLHLHDKEDIDPGVCRELLAAARKSLIFVYGLKTSSTKDKTATDQCDASRAPSTLDSGTGSFDTPRPNVTAGPTGFDFKPPAEVNATFTSAGSDASRKPSTLEPGTGPFDTPRPNVIAGPTGLDFKPPAEVNATFTPPGSDASTGPPVFTFGNVASYNDNTRSHRSESHATTDTSGPSAATAPPDFKFGTSLFSAPNQPNSTSNLTGSSGTTGPSSLNFGTNVFGAKSFPNEPSATPNKPNANPAPSGPNAPAALTSFNFGINVFGAKSPPNEPSATLNGPNANPAPSGPNATAAPTSFTFGTNVFGAKSPPNKPSATLNVPNATPAPSGPNATAAPTSFNFDTNVFGVKSSSDGPDATPNLTGTSATAAPTGPNFGTNIFSAMPHTGEPNAAPNTTGPHATAAPFSFNFGTNILGAKSPNKPNTRYRTKLSASMGPTGANSGASLFGAKPAPGATAAPMGANSGASLFGASAAPTGANSGIGMFGSKPGRVAIAVFTDANAGANLFGPKPAPDATAAPIGANSGTSLFGASAAPTGTNSGIGMFGAKPVPFATAAPTGANSGPSLFGAKPAPVPSAASTGANFGASLFGAKPTPVATAAPTGANAGASLFGANPAPVATAAPTGDNSIPSLFGAKLSAATGANSIPSLFGAKPSPVATAGPTDSNSNAPPLRAGHPRGAKAEPTSVSFAELFPAPNTTGPHATAAPTGLNFGTNVFGTKSLPNATSNGPNATPVPNGLNATTAATGFNFGTNIVSPKSPNKPNTRYRTTLSASMGPTGANSGASLFGAKPAPGATAAPMGANAGASLFGANPAPVATAAPTGDNSIPSLFGAKPSAATGANSIPSLFGAKPAPVATAGPTGANSGPSLFGAKPAPVPSAASTGANFVASLFDSNPAPVATTAPTGPNSIPSLFGTKPSAATGANSIPSLFGAKPAPAATAGPTDSNSNAPPLRAGHPRGAKAEPTSVSFADLFGAHLNIRDAPLKPTGTSFVTYKPVEATQDGVHVRYQCIVHMKEYCYRNQSVDELRLEDYAAGRAGRDLKEPTPDPAAGTFGQTMRGLVSSMSARPGLRRLTLCGQHYEVPGPEPALAAHWPPGLPADWGLLHTAYALETLRSGLSAVEARLEELNFINTTFGPFEVDVLETLLQSRLCSKLQLLRLIGVSLGAVESWRLADACSGLSSLRLLCLTGNALRSDHLAALAQALEKAGAPLTTLDAAGCALGAALPGLRRLLQGSAGRQLEMLDLSDNDFGALAPGVLSTALRPPPPPLRVLELARCRLADQHAAELALLLQKATSLEEVSLESNSFGIAGALALTLALAGCAALRRLDLSGSALGPAGAEAVAEALPRLKHLREIVLRNCSLQAEGVRRLETAFKENSELLLLDEERSPVDGATRARLVRVACAGAGSFVTAPLDAPGGGEMKPVAGLEWVYQRKP